MTDDLSRARYEQCGRVPIVLKVGRKPSTDKQPKLSAALGKCV